jgi:hypothetical protein
MYGTRTRGGRDRRRYWASLILNPSECPSRAWMIPVVSAGQKGASMSRIAQCSCGSLRAEANGEPVLVHVCNCTECQRRTGSVFLVNSFFPKSEVHTQGPSKVYIRDGQEGRKLRLHFCPECGTTYMARAMHALARSQLPLVLSPIRISQRQRDQSGRRRSIPGWRSITRSGTSPKRQRWRRRECSSDDESSRPASRCQSRLDQCLRNVRQ